MDKLINFLDASQLWVSSHTDLLALVGIPLLTILVTWRTNRAAENRATKQRKIERKLAQELKLVDFRQAWINELRGAFVEYHGALYADGGTHNIDMMRVAQLITKITLLMNSNDPDYPELVRTRKALIAEVAAGNPAPSLAGSNDIAKKILKREWERLKADLKKVEEIE